MPNNINQYAIERFSFGDDDYYDVDYWDGLVYRTAKIKGITIKNGMTVTPYKPPYLDFSLAVFNTGVLIFQNTAGAGSYYQMKGTSVAPRFDFNILLAQNGQAYGGQALKLYFYFQMPTNAGGNATFLINYKFVKAGVNAEATGTTITTVVSLAGVSINLLVEQLLATLTGNAGDTILMLSITRQISGNTNFIDAIGLRLTL